MIGEELAVFEVETEVETGELEADSVGDWVEEGDGSIQGETELETDFEEDWVGVAETRTGEALVLTLAVADSSKDELGGGGDSDILLELGGGLGVR